jgi:hypothetical protein
LQTHRRSTNNQLNHSKILCGSKFFRKFLGITLQSFAASSSSSFSTLSSPDLYGSNFETEPSPVIYALKSAAGHAVAAVNTWGGLVSGAAATALGDTSLADNIFRGMDAENERIKNSVGPIPSNTTTISTVLGTVIATPLLLITAPFTPSSLGVDSIKKQAI